MQQFRELILNLKQVNAEEDSLIALLKEEYAG